MLTFAVDSVQNISNIRDFILNAQRRLLLATSHEYIDTNNIECYAFRYSVDLANESTHHGATDTTHFMTMESKT